ncbi:MAG: hypothetical protein ABIQ00_11730, partial [Chitinophagaceae bacterium]
GTSCFLSGCTIFNDQTMLFNRRPIGVMVLLLLSSPPYSRRGSWIPPRNAEFNGGGYTVCCRQMAFEILQPGLLCNTPQQPPPFRHVLRIVSEHPLFA